MKSIRNIAFSALLTFGAFGAITYTSCNKDECKDVVCQNGGTCNEGNCECPTGYEGTSCETLSRDKFIGVWTGTDQCTSDNYNVTLTISTSSNQVNALVANPGGFGNSVTITGNISAVNTLTFSSQSLGGGRTLNGTMTLTSGVLNFDYTVAAVDGDGDSCSGTYAKQ